MFLRGTAEREAVWPGCAYSGPMNSRHIFRRIVRSATAVLGLAVAGVALASPGLTILHVVGLPVSVGVPPGWSVRALPRGDSFFAQSADGFAELGLTVNRVDTMPFAQFAKLAVDSARQNYLTQDPKASIRYRQVRLPAGEAIEVITRYHLGYRGKTLVALAYSYGFHHGRQAYNFTYTTLQPSDSGFSSLAQQSARSIRFSR